MFDRPAGTLHAMPLPCLLRAPADDVYGRKALAAMSLSILDPAPVGSHVGVLAP